MKGQVICPFLKQILEGYSPEKCFCLNLYIFELGPPLFISLTTDFFFIAGLSPITSNFVLLKKLKSRAKTTLTN